MKMKHTYRLFVFGLCAGATAAPIPDNLLKSPPEIPTRVYVTFAVNTLRKIDAVDSTFKMDFYVNVAWKDSRLANETNFDESTMFQPAPEFINTDASDYSVDMVYTIIRSQQAPGWLDLTPAEKARGDVWVAGAGRKTGTFVADLDLVNFPFDRQNATIRMESALWTADKVRFVPTANIANSMKPSAGVGGWEDLGARVYTKEHYYTGLEESYHRMEVQTRLRRQYAYYLSRVISNMILLSVMAFLVIFINGDEPDRLGFVQTSFLGVVSWLFVLNSETPKIGYLTTLDSFTQLTFAAIFVQYLYVAFHQGFYKILHRKRTGATTSSLLSPTSSAPSLVSPAPSPTNTGKPRLHIYELSPRQHSEGSVPAVKGAGVQVSGSNPMHAVGIDVEAASVKHGESKKDSSLHSMIVGGCLRAKRRFAYLRYHKRVDLAFALAIVLSYSIGVGVIIGMGVTQANAD